MKKNLKFLLIVILMFIFGQDVEAATLDVCASGCTYSTIKAAVDAANDSDVITVKNGTYKENLITITKKITIKGESATDTIINPAAAKGIFEIKSQTADVTIKDLSISSVKDIAVSVNGATATINNVNFNDITKHAIYADGNSKINVSGGTIKNAGSCSNEECSSGYASIKIYESEANIQNVSILDAKEDAIYIGSATGLVSLKQINIKGIDDQGINISASKNVVIENLTAENITKNAIYAYGNSKINVNGGTIKNAGSCSNEECSNGYPSIKIYESEANIQNVSISSGKTWAIYIENAPGLVSLKQINIKDIGFSGIQIKNSKNVVIENLTAENITQNAIYAYGNSKINVNGGTIKNAGSCSNEECSSGYDSIFINESEANIQNVSISSGKTRAISISGATGLVSLKQINIKDIGWSGIKINNSKNVVIENLTAENITHNAIYASGNSKINVNGGTIKNAGSCSNEECSRGYASISISESEGNIQNVSISSGKTWAIYIENATAPIILNGNNFTNMKRGIRVDNSSDVKIINQFISDVEEYGVKLFKSIVNAENIMIVNYGTNAIETDDNSALVLKNNEKFSLNGYQFLGWSLEKKCNSYLSKSNYNTTDAIKLHSCYQGSPINGDFSIEDDIVANPQTNDVNIFLIMSLVIIAIGSLIWYYKTNIKNKKIES